MKMVLFGIVALGVWAVGSHALLDWGRATGHLSLAIGILIGLAMALGLWRNLFLVEGSEVTVWDSVAGHFTNLNSLSAGTKARIIRLARSAA